MGSNIFVDSVYEMVDSLGKNKKKNDASKLLLASMDELRVDKNELNDKIDWPQGHISIYRRIPLGIISLFFNQLCLVLP